MAKSYGGRPPFFDDPYTRKRDRSQPDPCVVGLHSLWKFKLSWISRSWDTVIPNMDLDLLQFYEFFEVPLSPNQKRSFSGSELLNW